MTPTRFLLATAVAAAAPALPLHAQAARTGASQLQFGTTSVSWGGSSLMRTGFAFDGALVRTAGRWPISTVASGLLVDGALARGHLSVDLGTPWRAGAFRASFGGALDRYDQPGLIGGSRGHLAFGVASDGRTLGSAVTVAAGMASHNNLSRQFGEVRSSGWITMGDVRVTVGLSGSVATPLVPDALAAPSNTPDGSLQSLRYGDASVAVDAHRGPLEISLVGARRFGSRLSMGNWGRAGLALGIGDGTALTLSLASVPVDPLLHQAARHEVSVGVRLAPFRVGAKSHMVRGLAYDARVLAGQLRLKVEGAERVEILGSFNDWQAQPLAARTKDEWVLAVPLAPGLHRYVVRVNGGPWQVPDGAALATDEFFGSSALVVVPER